MLLCNVEFVFTSKFSIPYIYRESMSPEEQNSFWRSVQSIVEKDVVRTDRTHPYFKGDNNPNIEILQ